MKVGFPVDLEFETWEVHERRAMTDKIFHEYRLPALRSVALSVVPA